MEMGMDIAELLHTVIDVSPDHVTHRRRCRLDGGSGIPPHHQAGPPMSVAVATL